MPRLDDEDAPAFVHLNVGGTAYLVGRNRFSTLELANSRLAQLIVSAEADGGFSSAAHPVCIDRNGWAFGHVLDFLREGPGCLLPTSPRELDRLLIEADYFELPAFVAHLERALDLWSQQLAFVDQHPNDDRYFLVRERLIRVPRSAKARSQLLLDKFLPANNPRRLGYTIERPMIIDRDPELFEKCFSANNPRDLLPWHTKNQASSGGRAFDFFTAL